MPRDVAERRAHMPAGTQAILNARSLQASHRRLAALVAPGLSVLDAGCGTGAITRGIAEVVGPRGRVVGLDHLAELFAAAGLRNVGVTPQHEATRRDDPDFGVRAGLWADAAATRGRQMVEDGVLTEAERAGAEADYRAWLRDGAESQTMYLLAVEGVRPT